MGRAWNGIFLSVSAALTIVSFQNCSNEVPAAAKSGGLNNSSSSPVGQLSVPATAVEIEALQLYEIKPTGGVKPYIYTLVSGSGTIDTAGNFSGPAGGDVSVVEVKDAKDTSIAVTITTIAPLQLTHLPMAPKTTEIVQLTPSGGKPPYNLQLLAGVGTLTGNMFSPGSPAASTNWFRLTDSRGRLVESSITVNATPSLNIYYYFMTVVSEFSTDTYTFYSPSDSEAAFGYQLGGVRGVLFTENANGRTPVRRCRLNNINIYSYLKKGNCAGGYADAGIVGYVSETQVPNSRPIYSNNTNDNYSSAWSFTANGLSLMGYVPN